MAETFEVGQTVTIHDHYRGPVKITTVEKITHGGKRVVTADGLEWKMPWGHRWGCTDKYYNGPAIRQHRDGDHEAILRRKLVGHIVKFAELLDGAWKAKNDVPHSTDDLRSIVAAIKAARQSTPSADASEE